jgi:hypothetical protein
LCGMSVSQASSLREPLKIVDFICMSFLCMTVPSVWH